MCLQDVLSASFALSTHSKCLPPLSRHSAPLCTGRKRSRVEGGVGPSENCDLCNQPGVGHHHSWHNIDCAIETLLLPHHSTELNRVDNSKHGELVGYRQLSQVPVASQTS